MLRTATNRVGCVFWSAPPSRPAQASLGACPQPLHTPPSPAQAQVHAAATRLPWLGWLACAWSWLQDWLPYVPSLPSGVEPMSASALSPAARRALVAAQLISHPVDLSADTDTDTDSEAGADQASSAACPLRNCLIPGPDVAPRAPVMHPPPGLQVGFALTRQIAAPMHAIAQVICDSDRGHAWIDRCSESCLLEPTSTGPIAYHRYALPFVGDRDSVTRSTLEAVDANTLKITVQPWDSPEVAVPDGTVRIPWMHGSFTLVAQSPEVTSVCHTSQLVLGGGIPGWLGPVLRRRQAKSPKHTLSRLAMLVEHSAPQD